MLCEHCSHNMVCKNYNSNPANECANYSEEISAVWVKGNSYPTYSDDTRILVNCTKYTCRFCGWTYFENSRPFNFCPNCGSKMIGING